MRQVRSLSVVSILLAGIFLCWHAVSAIAAVTAEQKKEIAAIKKELGKVQGLIAKKEFDEAKKILDDSQAKMGKIAAEAKLMEGDPALVSVMRQIIQRRGTLDKKLGAAGEGIDFEKEVAPLLAAKCAGCHGEEKSSSGLRLDTFEALETASRTKQLIVPGDAANSSLLVRVSVSGEKRMPKDGTPLSDAEIATIASWINQGASFKGDKSDKFMAAPKPGSKRPPKNSPPPVIAKATGKEKVSFIKDIAPWMVNLCGNCHGGNNPRGGLSLVNFEGLMRGGDTGPVVLIGNRDGSRLWHLVGGIEEPRMPQGQARITKKNYEDLKTWLDEGAKFDGGDIKRPLREMVPTEEQRIAAELAKLTPEQFVAKRKEESDEQWMDANPKEPKNTVESDEFLVYGNVSEERLKEVLGWADEHAKILRSSFGASGPALWRGKLAVFVFKDRFTYAEFAQVIESAEIPNETIGHSRVTPSFAEAYICVQDIGDQVTTSSPGMKLNVADQITGAFLKRGGDKVPEWLIRGLGLALGAGKEAKKNEFLKNQPLLTVEALKGIEKPEQIFEKGKFSSADLGPIGYTLVQHMLTAGGGPKKLGMFIEKLQSGMDQESAAKGIYGSDLAGLGYSYLSTLTVKRPGKIKMK
jgi:cytochrome c553